MVTTSAVRRTDVRANYGAGLAVAVVRVLPAVAAVALLVGAAPSAAALVLIVAGVVVIGGRLVDRRRPGCRCRIGSRRRTGSEHRRRRGRRWARSGDALGRRSRSGSRGWRRGRRGCGCGCGCGCGRRRRRRSGGRRGSRRRGRSRRGYRRLCRRGPVTLHGQRHAMRDSRHRHRLRDEHRRALRHRAHGHGLHDRARAGSPQDSRPGRGRRYHLRSGRQRPGRTRRDLRQLGLERLPPEVGARGGGDHEQGGLRPGEPDRHRPPPFDATRFFPSDFAR